jgi:spore coat protein A, manganese oxidase
MELARRDMLKMGILGSAALLLPLERAARTALRLDRLPTSQLPDPFKVPFVRPPVLRPVKRTASTDYFISTMKPARVEIIPGFKTVILGYNGVTPGPTIMMHRGRGAVVRHINRINRTTSVHLHGNASLPQYDGYAEDVTRPNFYKDYHYPNGQTARTLWYHDHAIHHTAHNAYQGLAAFYITHDHQELNLPIPHGRYDVPLVIRDALFASNGALLFDDGGHSSLQGDVILVNGRPWPRMKVERRKYRFRILNASISRSYRLALDSGEDLTVIATDGGLTPHPQRTESLRIGMAERYEVVIDFSKYRVGERVILKNLGLPSNVDYPSTRNIMAFDVVSEPTSRRNNSIPDSLNPGNPVMRLQESDARGRVRRFKFERESGLWTINGKTWDPERVDAHPKLNATEIWELSNNSSGWFHPVHIHLIDFKILDRNGRPPLNYERGPKDVVYVGEGETVRVIAKFGPRRGKYMMHCHNLVHEDHDMMTQFEVGDGGPDPVDAARPRALPGTAL